MKISGAIDALYTLIGTTLSSRSEMSNPYLRDSEGNYHRLKSGWGVTVNGSSRVEVEFNCVTTRYDVSVVLTDALRGQGGATSTKTAVKSLHDDASALIVALENNTLGGNAFQLIHDGLSSITVQGDGTERWLELSVDLEFNISEAL